jgi:hypothetical protein
MKKTLSKVQSVTIEQGGTVVLEGRRYVPSNCWLLLNPG